MIKNAASLLLRNFGKIKTCTINNYSKSTAAASGELITVGCHKVHIEKYGHGKEIIFFMPGSMGTPKTDFNPQLEHLDRDKFTLIGWSPPGNGHSSPYDVQPIADLVHKDAEVAAGLLKELGLEKINVVGWCAGGITAIVMCANHPEVAKKLLVIAPWVRISAEDAKSWEGFKDITTWDPVLLDPLVEMYGFENVKKKWDVWVDLSNEIVAKKKGELAVEECARIKCPTLLVHSRDDNFVVYDRHAHFTTSLIPNAKLISMKEGRHAVHLRSVQEFNLILENFINYEQEKIHLNAKSVFP